MLRDHLLPVNLYMLRDDCLPAKLLVLCRQVLREEAVRKHWLRSGMTCPSHVARVVLPRESRTRMGDGLA